MTKAVNYTTLSEGLAFPEGPAFAPDGSLWAVELKGGRLVRLSEGTLTRYNVGGKPNGIAIDANGLLWFCDAGENAIRRFAPATGQVTILAHQVAGQPLNQPNDLAFDSAGNLLFTCPGNSRQEPTGYVCVRRPNGAVQPIASGLYFPNGLAFTATGAELVIAETYRHRLWKGRWNAQTTEWTDAQPWCAIGGPEGPGGPDGMAFGEDGNLYVAVYGTGEVRVVNPAGQVTQRIQLPGQNPTNCAFDPAGRLGLVVTEAEAGQLISFPDFGRGIGLHTGKRNSTESSTPVHPLLRSL